MFIYADVTRPYMALIGVNGSLNTIHSFMLMSPVLLPCKSALLTLANLENGNSVKNFQVFKDHTCDIAYFSLILKYLIIFLVEVNLSVFES